MPSTIEWTQETWNPTTGCDRVSVGCDHCYALTLAKRLKGMGAAKYQTDGNPRTSGPGFGVAVHPGTLDVPRRWRRPRRVFVNSMSDLFHAGVPDAFIARVFAVMAVTPQHTYQILTKRHGRMRSLLSSPTFWHQVTQQGRDHVVGCQQDWLAVAAMLGGDPLSNVWLGVSVEDQQRADLRIPALLDTPTAVRWLSCEPLLAPVDLDCWLPRLDWVVVGGESGPAARPLSPDWARTLRDQCTAAGTPFFFKQWGGHTPKTNGRHLDGRTWDQYPDQRIPCAC